MFSYLAAEAEMFTFLYHYFYFVVNVEESCLANSFSLSNLIVDGTIQTHTLQFLVPLLLTWNSLKEEMGINILLNLVPG